MHTYDFHICATKCHIPSSVILRFAGAVAHAQQYQCVASRPINGALDLDLALATANVTDHRHNRSTALIGFAKQFNNYLYQ